MCAKHYENPTMLSRVTAKNAGDVFLRHTVVQSRSSHEKAVCLSVRQSVCLSVRLSVKRVICEKNKRKLWTHSQTTWKNVYPSFRNKKNSR